LDGFSGLSIGFWSVFLFKIQNLNESSKLVGFFVPAMFFLPKIPDFSKNLNHADWFFCESTKSVRTGFVGFLSIF
jgi:hypothetical protein